MALGCFPAHASPPDGYVVRVDSAVVYLDWGTASGVQAGDRFDVYRDGEALKHPITGEILGKTKEPLGSGTLQSLEAKFAVGHLDSVKISPHAGDHTHWLGPVSSGAAVSELWRSDPLEKDAAGITFADLGGDGKKDIIVAYRKKIVAYRYNDKKLEPIATFDNRSFRRWLAVDAIDLKHDGHEEIFATTFLEGMNRARVVVLRYENGRFRQMGDFEGFARVIQRLDGSRHLYWQNMAPSHDVSYTAVSELVWEKNAYKPGPSINLQLSNDQLFGFAWGDWFKSGSENVTVLEHGERIHVYSGDVKWKSSDVFGGTKNDFPFNENALGSVLPRLESWRPANADRDQLIIPTNSPDLGFHTTYFKIYKKSELAGWDWNGQEMKPAWHIPISGYLADYGIADILGQPQPQPQPQLWAAVVGTGDKTVLISYSLPE